MLIKELLTVFCGISVLSVSGFASAHSSFVEKEFVQGTTVELSLRVPHGCDGNPTKKINIEMPNGLDKDPALGEAVMRVKPKLNANWRTIKPSYGEVVPFERHGTVYDEDLRGITWAGGRLPDGFYETFQFRLTLPNLPEWEDEKILYFPVIQTCTKQTENEWVEIPVDGERLPRPAPWILIKRQ